MVSWAHHIFLLLSKHDIGIKPFYLHMQAEDEAHLCPIRALAEWVEVSRINKGYLFRRIWSGDRVADLDKNTPMVSFRDHIILSIDNEYDSTDIRAVLGTVPE